MGHLPGGLVGPTNWINSIMECLRDTMAPTWSQPDGSTDIEPARIVCWLGNGKGVTPDRAHLWIEPYAEHRNTQQYHSVQAWQAYGYTVAMKHAKSGGLDPFQAGPSTGLAAQL